MLFKSPLGDLGETIFFLKIKRFKKTPFEKMCYICQINSNKYYILSFGGQLTNLKYNAVKMIDMFGFNYKVK